MGLDVCTTSVRERNFESKKPRFNAPYKNTPKVQYSMPGHWVLDFLHLANVVLIFSIKDLGKRLFLGNLVRVSI